MYVSSLGHQERAAVGLQGPIGCGGALASGLASPSQVRPALPVDSLLPFCHREPQRLSSFF